ncbi:MAG: hypothetical protein AB8G18_18625 [Gammaproteobacteria bacterium]
MKFSVISLTVLATVLLGACSTTSELDGIVPKEPNPIVGFLAQGLIDVALDAREDQQAEKRCLRNNTSRRITADRKKSACRGAGQRSRDTRDRLESEREEQERIEDKKRSAVLKESFDNRKSTSETANMIERVQRRNDWITESEQKQQSVIVVDKPDELE